MSHTPGNTSTSVPTLEARNLAFAYRSRSKGETVALRRVSFSIARGEVMAVAGPNGSGKSTLFRIVVGALQQKAGTLEIGGRPARAAMNAGEVGVLFQSPSLDKGLTVWENLYHHALLFGIVLSRKRLPETVATLGLSDMLDARANTLSGGYQRRVELAKVLSTNPALLALDEPFNGLDVASREAVMRAIRQWSDERGVSAFIITHQDDVAAQCDSLLLLEAGEVLAHAAPSEFLARLGERVIEITSSEILPLLATLGDSAVFNVAQLAPDKAILYNCHPDDLLHALARYAETTSSVAVRTPSLDDFFAIRAAGATLGLLEKVLAA